MVQGRYMGRRNNLKINVSSLLTRGEVRSPRLAPSRSHAVISGNEQYANFPLPQKCCTRPVAVLYRSSSRGRVGKLSGFPDVG